jgi:hypothetical protein
MLPLTLEAIENTMKVADVQTNKYRKVLNDLENNKWGHFIDDPKFKHWLKSELKRNQRMTQEPEKRIRAWAQGIKTSLPAYCFSAWFDESIGEKYYNKGKKGCWREQQHSHLTGLAVCDFDHVEEPHLIFERWRQSFDFQKEGIMSVFITPSGKGLKVVFKARMEWGNLIDNQYSMAELLGLEAKIDKSCKDASRIAFTSTTTDMKFLDKNIFTFQNDSYEQRYGKDYREGKTAPTKLKWLQKECIVSTVATNSVPVASTEQAKSLSEQLYRGKYSYTTIVQHLVEILGTPAIGDRHATMMTIGRMLSLITDNDPELLTSIVSEIPFVKDIINERNEDVPRHMKYVCDHPSYFQVPKELRQALQMAGVKETISNRMADPMLALPIDRWCDTIEQLFPYFPCLLEICEPHPRGLWPMLFFASAAFFGTLMTRCWYRFYDDPDEQKRLNYNINGIGDPASNKRIIVHLFEILSEPIKKSDQKGIDAVNQYNKEQQERETSKKEQEKSALKKPTDIIRIHPARTSNSTFIEDMVNAVEMIYDEPWHLHLLTFDSELDNTIRTQKAGTWIEKLTFELKAFHNEWDGQAYSNKNSIRGDFRVYWNIVTTGTPQALQHKVNSKTFPSGLALRLATLPIPSTGFKMMPLKKPSNFANKNDAVLRDWAIKLDKRKGELPLWTLTEHCWQWTADKMEMAGFNQDKADEMLIKRVPHYGMNISAPFIDMRHWQEREETGTYEIDDIDKQLCSLVLDIQYRSQHYFFGEYCRQYFENQLIDAESYGKRRSTHFSECFRQLPENFNTEKFTQVFNYSNNHSAQKALTRLVADHAIERLQRGEYRKVVDTLDY